MIRKANPLAVTALSAVLVFLSMISSQLRAETVIQFYGGGGFTQRHNAYVDLPDAGLTATHDALQFDSATTVGGRAAYWMGTFPYLGLGIDGAHFFGPDQKSQVSLTNLCVAGIGCSTSPENLKKFNNNVTMIGLDVLLRYPLLTSTQYRKGRLQSYFSVGPAIFITTLKDTDNFIPLGQSSTYTSLGVKAGAGLMLFITQHMSMVIEYRNTHFQVKNKYYNATVVHDITLGKTLGNATFNIQSIVGGVAFSF